MFLYQRTLYPKTTLHKHRKKLLFLDFICQQSASRIVPWFISKIVYQWVIKVIYKLRTLINQNLFMIVIPNHEGGSQYSLTTSPYSQYFNWYLKLAAPSHVNASRIRACLYRICILFLFVRLSKNNMTNLLNLLTKITFTTLIWTPTIKLHKRLSQTKNVQQGKPSYYYLHI